MVDILTCDILTLVHNNTIVIFCNNHISNNIIILFRMGKVSDNVQQLADVDFLISPSDKEEPATWQMRNFKRFRFKS
jgi:hypothetical protein